MSETDATICSVCGGPFSAKRIIIGDRAMHQACSYMSHPPHTWDDYARLSDECARLLDREAREKEITRLATIEQCASLIESGAGMADLIDQDELDQQAKYIRALKCTNN